MAFDLDQILNELDAAQEKTAEQSFTESILSDSADTVSTATEEKVAEDASTTEDSPVTEEKVAEDASTTEDSPVTEEKVAEDASEELVEEEKIAEDAVENIDDKVLEEKIASVIEETFVKVADEIGKVAAMSFFNELVAMGTAVPTNYHEDVPPVSAVSRSSESPVTVAADAMHQEAAGHDAYDAKAMQAHSGKGMMKEKKASISDDFIKNLTKKLTQGE